MTHPNATGGNRTAVDNATVRSVFVVGPDKKIKAMIIYPMSTGRNFDEVLRLLDSVQLSSRHTVATPGNWKPGQDVIIPTSVSDEEAKKKYPQGFKTLKPYLRTVAQPKEGRARARRAPSHPRCLGIGVSSPGSIVSRRSGQSGRPR